MNCTPQRRFMAFYGRLSKEAEEACLTTIAVIINMNDQMIRKCCPKSNVQGPRPTISIYNVSSSTVCGTAHDSRILFRFCLAHFVLIGRPLTAGSMCLLVHDSRAPQLPFRALGFWPSTDMAGREEYINSWALRCGQMGPFTDKAIRPNRPRKKVHKEKPPRSTRHDAA